MDKFPYFFPRGDGPLISVLLPTRGRPDYLCNALDSLCSLAADMTRLEFILKVDDDDKETISVVEKLESKINIKKIVSPRGNGYKDMHHWINSLCEMSSGDWLTIMNDDIKMTTHGWDDLILNIGTGEPWIGINRCCLLWIPTVGRPDAQEFVMIRRGVYEILGHFSLSPHCDNWIYSIMKFVGATLFTKIEIEHYSDIINDKTRQESEAAYKDTQASLTSLASKKAKVEDVNKLINYFKEVEDRMEWTFLPSLDLGWFWWKENISSKPINVFYNKDTGVFFFKDGSVCKRSTVKELGGLWCIRE